MPACSPNLVADINHLERILRLATRLVTDMRHLPYEERLQRRKLRADLVAAFKIITGLLDTDLNYFFSSHPYKVPQGASHLQRRGSAISVSGLKYLNKLLTSEVIAPSVNIFKKMFGESLDRSLSPSPPLTEHSSPHFPTPPHPVCTPPINSQHLNMLPNSLYILCDFFKPVVVNVLPLQY